MRTRFTKVINRLIKKEFFLLCGVSLVLFLSLLSSSVTWASGHWASSVLIVDDGATFLVTAIAHNKGLGSPYKDYWEYRPPGFFFMLDVWAKAFGSSVMSFKALEGLTHLLIGLEVIFILRRIFSPIQGFIIGALTNIVFFSPVFGFMLYPEPYAIFFSLLGLLCLLYIEKIGWKFFLASLFFSFSIQLKDTFMGGALALLPPALSVLFTSRKAAFRILLAVLGGFVFPLLVLGLYLIKLGALSAYFEVLNHKSGLVHYGIFDGTLWDRYFRFFLESKQSITVFNDQRIGFLFLFFAVVLVWQFRKNCLFAWVRKGYKIFVKIKLKALSAPLVAPRFMTLLLYSLGSLFGPALEFTLAPHYITAFIIPLYLFWGSVASFTGETLRRSVGFIPRNAVFIPAVFLFLYPAQWITVQYQGLPENILGQAYKNITISDAFTKVEKYIQSKTAASDCILSVYGWKSAGTYLYSERRPCTRFITPNIVNVPWQKKEYRKAILNNPPKAVFYSIDQADMDYRRFESEVFDIPRMLNGCYKLDTAYTYSFGHRVDLYFPALSGEELKNCVVKNINEKN